MVISQVKEELLFLLALLIAGHAAYQDLPEKVFTFLLEYGTSNVKLNATAQCQKPITALTVCLRFYSSLTRGQTLFSLSVPSEPNAFLLFKPTVGEYKLHISGKSLIINGLPDDQDEWNSFCWTWDSSNGLTVLWVNGKRSAWKILAHTATLTGAPIIILGQDQDVYGGGFEQRQSFVGDITDIRLWDSVISPCQICFYMEGNTFTPGNLLNWKNLQYSTTGSVYVEKSD